MHLDLLRRTWVRFARKSVLKPDFRRRKWLSAGVGCVRNSMEYMQYIDGYIDDIYGVHWNKLLLKVTTYAPACIPAETEKTS